MKLPDYLPGRPALRDRDSKQAQATRVGGLSPQGCDPASAALLCAGRAGFAACVARAIATGDVCDGGLTNCIHAC